VDEVPFPDPTSKHKATIFEFRFSSFGFSFLGRLPPFALCAFLSYSVQGHVS
jgi:hypothetical protein